MKSSKSTKYGWKSKDTAAQAGSRHAEKLGLANKDIWGFATKSIARYP